jgi:hypothetical protein
MVQAIEDRNCAHTLRRARTYLLFTIVSQQADKAASKLTKSANFSFLQVNGLQPRYGAPKTGARTTTATARGRHVTVKAK